MSALPFPRVMFAVELARQCWTIRGVVTNQTRTWPRRGIICLVLGLITLAVFWPALTHDFLVYDDQAYVTENPPVRAGLTWPGVVWAFTSFSVTNWHPLTWLSHMLDCQLYGLKPAGHHLTSLLLHTASTLLLFLGLSRMTGALWRSAAVAALFAWHPLHVESVAWVAERKDVLSAFFFMLTLGAYARYVGESKVQSLKSKVLPGAAVRQEPSANYHAAAFRLPPSRYYFLSLLFFALGLMSKPMLVTLPFVLLLLDYWPLRRIADCGVRNAESGGGRVQGNAAGWGRLVVEKIPFLALSVVACVLTVAAQQQGYAITSTAGLPLSRRIPHALVSYGHYLGAMLFPRHLAAHYPYVPEEPVFKVAGAVILLALLSFMAIRLAARRPYLVVGWLWFLGTLVPVIGLVQVGDQAWADRYTYLPLIGLFVALVWWVSDLAGAPAGCGVMQSEGAKPAAGRRSGLSVFRVGAVFPLGVIAVTIGLAMLAGTSLQLRHWKNTRTLFEHAAAVTQGNNRALTVLGSLAATEGNLNEAKRLYAEALTCNPHNPETRFHLGKLLDQEGKLDAAIAEYRQVLWSRQWRENAYLALGVALAKQKKYDEAAANYRAVLKLNPESAVAHNNLARILHTQGRLDEAIVHYTAALKLDPRLAQAHNNLGVLFLQKGQLAESITQLREALRLRRGDPESQINLAQALTRQEQWAEAAELFEKTVTAATADPNIHCQFALALAHLQRTREAMSHYASALLLQQDLPAALDGLSWILATDANPGFRNGTEAVRMSEHACELTGRKDPALLRTLAAAYAEFGRFPEATATAQTAHDLAAQTARKALADECRRMLEQFQAAKPWRQ